MKASKYNPMAQNHGGGNKKGGYRDLHKRVRAAPPRKSLAQKALALFHGDDGDDAFVDVSLSRDEIMFGYNAKRPKCLILNDNLKLKGFSLFMYALVLLVAVLYPFKLGFEPRLPWYLPFFEYTIDLFFVFDVCLHFMVTYQSPMTHFFVSDHRHIALKYWRHGHFKVDCLGALPLLGVATLFLPPGLEKALHPWASVLANVRLVRVYKLFSKSGYTKKDVTSQNQKLFLLWLFLIFALFIHWFGCLFGGIGLYFEQRGNHDNWLRDKELEAAPISDRYTFALYWSAMSFTSVGYGD